MNDDHLTAIRTHLESRGLRSEDARHYRRGADGPMVLSLRSTRLRLVLPPERIGSYSSIGRAGRYPRHLDIPIGPITSRIATAIDESIAYVGHRVRQPSRPSAPPDAPTSVCPRHFIELPRSGRCDACGDDRSTRSDVVHAHDNADRPDDEFAVSPDARPSARVSSDRLLNPQCETSGARRTDEGCW